MAATATWLNGNANKLQSLDRLGHANLLHTTTTALVGDTHTTATSDFFTDALQLETSSWLTTATWITATIA